ncbi:MAG TPA: SDR family oxidoreductase [Terriglobales bacterium]
MHNGRKTALITGASLGIGRELAKLFAANQYDLVLVSRSAPRLAEFANQLQQQFGIHTKSFPLDLASGSAPQFLFDQLSRENIVVDVLVNNAGFGKLGSFSKVSLEDSLGQIQLNIVVLTHLTRLFLGPMLERKSGKILNVASTAGFQPGPTMAVYYATKAYVISFSEAIASELRETGVSVTCLCPGATDTNFQKVAGTEETTLFRRLRPMDAVTVARDGYRGLMKGKPLVISGLRNWLLTESLRLSPRRLVTEVSRRILE